MFFRDVQIICASLCFRALHFYWIMCCFDDFLDVEVGVFRDRLFFDTKVANMVLSPQRRAWFKKNVFPPRRRARFL